VLLSSTFLQKHTYGTVIQNSTTIFSWSPLSLLPKKKPTAKHVCCFSVCSPKRMNFIGMRYSSPRRLHKEGFLKKPSYQVAMCLPGISVREVLRLLNIIQALYDLFILPFSRKEGFLKTTKTTAMQSFPNTPIRYRYVCRLRFSKSTPSNQKRTSDNTWRLLSFQKLLDIGAMFCGPAGTKITHLCQKCL
jgi:hypothetical protein